MISYIYCISTLVISLFPEHTFDSFVMSFLSGPILHLAHVLFQRGSQNERESGWLLPVSCSSSQAPKLFPPQWLHRPLDHCSPSLDTLSSFCQGQVITVRQHGGACANISADSTDCQTQMMQWTFTGLQRE